MFALPVLKKDVLSDFPELEKDWINLAKEKFLGGKLDEEKMIFYYSYGFFLPKMELEEKIEYYQNLNEKIESMKFDERLQHELSKVRVNLTMMVGKNFILSNRLSGRIPSIVLSVVTEVTKVKMLVEYEYHNNEELRNSIPEIDNSIISFEIIRDVVKDENKSNLDIDSLLDKISEKGISSLSDTEKEFLDKKSKDI